MGDIQSIRVLSQFVAERQAELRIAAGAWATLHGRFDAGSAASSFASGRGSPWEPAVTLAPAP